MQVTQMQKKLNNSAFRISKARSSSLQTRMSFYMEIPFFGRGVFDLDFCKSERVGFGTSSNSVKKENESGTACKQRTENQVFRWKDSLRSARCLQLNRILAGWYWYSLGRLGTRKESVCRPDVRRRPRTTQWTGALEKYDSLRLH